MAQEGEDQVVKQSGEFSDFVEAFMLFSSVIGYNPIGATAVIIDMTDGRVICQATTAPDDDSDVSKAIIASLDHYKARVEEIRELEKQKANDSQRTS